MSYAHHQTLNGALLAYTKTVAWYRHDEQICEPGKYRVFWFDKPEELSFFFPGQYATADAVVDDFGNLVRTA